MLFPRRTIFVILFLCVATISHAQLGKPIIWLQARQVTTPENVAVAIQFSDLVVLDLDDTYPNGFTMQLYEGKNYTFSGTTVMPDKRFHGTLTVPVTVTDDGGNVSNSFKFKIRVTEVDNVRPIITDQVPLSMTTGESITLNLLQLTVTDPDNDYPDDFSLKVSSGKDYKVSNKFTVTPDADFTGFLTVPVTVDDGEDESEKFNLSIEVGDKPNVAPEITGQQPVATNEDIPLTILLTSLIVTDPDDPYPNGFVLTIHDGSNYTWTGNTVTPAKNFNGTLSVIVSVNDGQDDSDTFPLQVTVNAVNDVPVITGQEALNTYVNDPITIVLSNLKVTDPDNNYPNGFTLKIANGFNYEVSGNTITPAANFTGILTANVTVNDGTSTSLSFPLEIRVLTVPNVPPKITGQNPLPIQLTTGVNLNIQLGVLVVVDPDNTYPKGFTLKVYGGDHYTFSGTTITPEAGFSGTLSVPVTVNDGTDNSNKFNLQVEVIPPTDKPQIVGQESLITDEEEPITIELTNLVVSDADDTYPTGFTMQLQPGQYYTFQNHTVTPAKDRNGFLTVGVKVTDKDGNSSNIFNLLILVNPVNDPPVIKGLETIAISYEPGTDAVALTSTLEIEDIDNDRLSLVEISLGAENYRKAYDELLFTNTDNISSFFDADLGRLVLIGYGTLQEYTDAIRSVKYNYNLHEDETQGAPEILAGPRTISFQLNDGQSLSEVRKRDIVLETTIELDIPTAFTPNGDGANETWSVSALSNAHQCDNAIIRVYNKRGILLFETVGLAEQWNGIYNGQKLPMDTYYYTIDLKLSYAKRTYSGVVTILR